MLNGGGEEGVRGRGKGTEKAFLPFLSPPPSAKEGPLYKAKRCFPDSQESKITNQSPFASTCVQHVVDQCRGRLKRSSNIVESLLDQI